MELIDKIAPVAGGKGLVLGRSDFKRVKQHCDQYGAPFFCTEEFTARWETFLQPALATRARVDWHRSFNAVCR